MQITVCIGSSCHIKGSRQIVDRLLSLIIERKLEGRIDLEGSFCMGNCMNGVCVQLEGERFSLQPEDTEKFFETEVLGRL
jgi:NADH:ubiquinone oxidoreductase subunit E